MDKKLEKSTINQRKEEKMIWKIHTSYDWDALYQRFDWVRDMETTPQSPLYHAEGNVDIHTQMVLQELQQLIDFQCLSEEDQHILMAAALLHDVEKRSTTVQEPDGRITSKGHAKKGELTTRSVLYREVATPFSIREAVAKLVRYHGLPLWIFEKDNPVQYLSAISLEVDTELLAILAEADMRGRICPDQEEMLYRIELFRELCRENGCFGRPRYFASAITRYLYLRYGNVSPDHELFDDTRMEVILMSGIPGSGKDTYIRQNYEHLPVVSLDAIRREHRIAPHDKKGNGKVVQMAKEQARELMRQNCSFVWNATNTTRSMREQLIDLFLEYKAKVSIVYIETSYAQLIRQNREREHVVPTSVLEKLITKLEVPSMTEAHHINYIVS